MTSRQCIKTRSVTLKEEYKKMALEQSKELEEIKVMIQNQKQLVKDQAYKITELRSILNASEWKVDQLEQEAINSKHDHRLVNTYWCLIGLMSGIITGVML